MDISFYYLLVASRAIPPYFEDRFGEKLFKLFPKRLFIGIGSSWVASLYDSKETIYFCMADRPLFSLLRIWI